MSSLLPLELYGIGAKSIFKRLYWLSNKIKFRVAKLLELGKLRNWSLCPCGAWAKAESPRVWERIPPLPLSSVCRCRGALAGLRASKRCPLDLLMRPFFTNPQYKKEQEVKVNRALNSASIWESRSLLWKLQLKDPAISISLASAICPHFVC